MFSNGIIVFLSSSFGQDIAILVDCLSNRSFYVQRWFDGSSLRLVNFHDFVWNFKLSVKFFNMFSLFNYLKNLKDHKYINTKMLQHLPIKYIQNCQIRYITLESSNYHNFYEFWHLLCFIQILLIFVYFIISKLFSVDLTSQLWLVIIDY